MSELQDLLVLEHVTKVFESREGRNVVAVNDVSLSIRKGELITLLGPSGCGKTTTLRLIAGFELPTRGRILLEGQDIAYLPPNKREMGMVFQSYALFPHLSVFENIAYGLRLRRLSKEEIEQRVRTFMALVNLTGLEQRKPAALSGGQQQRVALARAMAIRPRVLLFDEPLSNLDAKLRVALRAEIRQIQQRLGITSVYVTHDQSEAMALSDRIVVMNEGRVEQVGTPEEVYHRPATLFVADFVGRANFLPAEVLQLENTHAIVQFAGKRLCTPAHPDVRPNKPAVLMVRPEAIRLTSHALESNDALDGVVRNVAFLGHYVEYELTWDQLVLSVEDESLPGRLFRQGERVRWHFDPERAFVLPKR